MVPEENSETDPVDLFHCILQSLPSKSFPVTVVPAISIPITSLGVSADHNVILANRSDDELLTRYRDWETDRKSVV